MACRVIDDGPTICTASSRLPHKTLSRFKPTPAVLSPTIPWKHPDPDVPERQQQQQQQQPPDTQLLTSLAYKSPSEATTGIW